MEEKAIIGHCEESGLPIYQGDSYIEDHGKMFIPEHYVPVKRTLIDKILRRQDEKRRTKKRKEISCKG